MSMLDIDVITPHWFWWTMTAACVVWYSTITVYVAFKGVSDIRNMLRRLSEMQTNPPSDSGAAGEAQDQ